MADGDLALTHLQKPPRSPPPLLLDLCCSSREATTFTLGVTYVQIPRQRSASIFHIPNHGARTLTLPTMTMISCTLVPIFPHNHWNIFINIVLQREMFHLHQRQLLSPPSRTP
ncbi:uncharacterized protein STEHIDRAFT_160224 [Stereum hirsutum FP-91666 SS1]|uniref:uncharacterized protein n=1 Tax=Stereum hirsutum (strain FP-91666) TaxID=721885 RepID=UPI0004449C64|nr:uncharacterized protein STEHIDRAFT_160224 [Stereum hirsutum FP-91666 SS1]EIM83648.1 hypothetical protein STEHIDRAFT_160224 [Stereum hirsutum FP-91666 SS1]